MPAILARRFRLQPVEHRVGEVGGILEPRAIDVLGHVDDRLLEVVEHRPVHEADVGGVSAGHEIAPRRDAPERPERPVARIAPLVRVDKRRLVVAITPEGLQLLNGAPTPLHEKFAAHLARLDADDQQQIDKTLKQVVAMMEAEHLDAVPYLDSSPDSLG